ncbi:MAG: T9SS type A sorting domain-containing protein, partial [Bacteroidota bacterium]
IQWNEKNETATVLVRDITGRIILSERVSGGNALLDASSLASGNYIIELQSNDTVVRKHIIKK